jgi:hypothetical protein
MARSDPSTRCLPPWLSPPPARPPRDAISPPAPPPAPATPSETGPMILPMNLPLTLPSPSDGERILPNRISRFEPLNWLKLVGRVTPCAPGLRKPDDGARGATRPTLRFMGSFDLQQWTRIRAMNLPNSPHPSFGHPLPIGWGEGRVRGRFMERVVEGRVRGWRITQRQ